MIVATPENNVVSSHGMQGSSEGYKIKANAHAFRMLSSGLYTDKVMAVLREIGCNAADAHVAEGTKMLPFDVKLPNLLDTQFYIRDYGPGLSHEDVMGLYMTYFESTKQLSNEFTGAFGLGSKSPFSYTDSFTVVSCHDGKQRTYSSHIGPNGIPNCVQMDERDISPNWKHGLQVGFPVEPKDFSEFNKKAQRAYCMFTPQPNILGAPLASVKLLRDRPQWMMVKDDRLLQDNALRTGDLSMGVRMGNVVYPLNLSALKATELGFMSNRRYYGQAPECTLILKADIGTLQVAGNREALQYDPLTISALEVLLTNALKDMVSMIETEWELKRGGTWKERCSFVSTAEDLTNTVKFDEANLEKFGAKNAKTLFAALNKQSIKSPFPTSLVVAKTLSKDTRSNINKLNVDVLGNHSRIKQDPDIVVLIADNSSVYGRTRQAIFNGDIARAIIIYPKKTAGGMDKDAKNYAALLDKELGEFEKYPLSKLPAAQKNVTKKLPKGQLATLPAFPVILGADQVSLDTVKERGYALINVRHAWGTRKVHYTIGGRRVDNYDFTKMLEHLTTLNAGIEKPVLLTPIQLKRAKLEKRSDWKEYGEYIKATLEDKGLQSKISATVKTFVPKITIEWAPPKNFVHQIASLRLRHSKQVLYDKVLAVAKKLSPKLYDKMLWMDTHGTITSQNMSPPKSLLAFNYLAGMFGVQSMDASLTNKSVELSMEAGCMDKFEWYLIKGLAEISEDAFLTLVQQYMKEYK